MQYVQLGNSGLVVSRFCLGTMLFGEGSMFDMKLTFDQKKADQIVGKAIDLGINFFDTADMYGNGQSETILGMTLGAKRKDVIISTKANFRTSNAPHDAGIGYKHLIESAERSLKRLGTDYIDVFIPHADDLITPIEETIKACEDLVRSGKVRYVGYSNRRTWKASTALQMQKNRGYSPFITSQMYYSLIARDLDMEYVPFADATGMGMMVWSPLSGGFLTGKYIKDNPKPVGGRLSKSGFFLEFDMNMAYKAIERIDKIGKRTNATCSQISLAWLLKKKFVSTIILGASDNIQFEENIKALDVDISDKDMAILDKLGKPVRTYPDNFYDLQDDILVNAKV